VRSLPHQLRVAGLGGALILAMAVGASAQEAAAGCTDCDAEALIAELGLRQAPAPVRERPGWTAPRKIVVRGDEAFVRSLQPAAPDVELVAAANVEAAVRAAPGADAVLGYCSSELLEAGDRIQWIQIYSAGAERCVSVPDVGRRELLLTNAQRIYGPEMAEHVMAMLFAFTRGLYRYIPEQLEGRWDRTAVPRDRMWEINGRTMLVVGLGGIGTEVARRAHALGMRVLATRRSSRSGPDFVDYVGLSDELGDLIGEADVVVTALPLTPETTGMFDAEFFAAMKPTAYFINVGRGRSVITDDLMKALEAGELAGAGLDVTDPEPLPATHPLWRLSNVIITPHVASSSVQAVERLQAVVRENLRRYVAGEPMLSVVDVSRGY
jgi:phosphoglycerate dehydrogenase-like enzyme